MENDLEVDEIWNNTKKKKKVDGNDKGHRGERLLCKILTERFKLPFSRVPQSGNRMSQVRLPDHVKEAYVGDIVTPKSFKYCIEVKDGYPDIDFTNIIAKNNGLKLIDSFLEQAERDAKKIDRDALLCWKPDYKPWICFLKAIPYPIDYQMMYKEWTAIALTHLLQAPDSHFFIR